MSSAQQGSKAYAEAYKKLGVSVTDSNGNLRDSETVYWESIDALGKMTNETERDALAMQLFGKSAQELNPLIEAGSEKMKELTQEAHDVGAVLSQETLDALGAFDDSIQRLKGSAGAAKNALGGVLLPELQMLTDAGGSFLSDFTVELNKSGGGLDGFAATVGSMSGQIGGLLSEVATKLLDSVATVAPALMQVAVSLATTLTTSLITMVPQFVTTGIDIIMALLTGLTQAIPQITTALVNMIPQLVNALVTGIPQLIQGAVQLLMALVQAIPQILPPLIAALPQIVLSIINGLLGAIPQLIQGAVQFLLAIVQAIPQIVAALVPQIPVIVTTVINGLLDNIPLLLDAAVTLLLAIVQAIPEIVVALIRALPQIITTIISFLGQLPGKIWNILKSVISNFVRWTTESRQKARDGMKKVATAVVDALKALPSKIKEVGKNLVQGLWNGIKDMVGWVKDKIKGFTSDVLDGIKSFFGIKSPSRVMRDQVGKMIAKGLAAGIDAGKPEVIKAMEDMENEVIQRAESIMGSFGLFDFASILTEESDIEGGDLLNNLSTQVTALQEWTDEMEELRGKIGSTDLFDALQALGVKNLHEVRAINKMTEGQLAQYVMLYDQKQSMAAALSYAQAGSLNIEQQAQQAGKTGAGGSSGSSNGSSSNAELLTKLNGIYERLGRLKWVTDTGELVGVLIDDIDAQLSERQRLVARGAK
jgi:phage-related protein